MAALLGLDFEAVVEVAEEAGQGEEICAAANDNAVGQVVVSGHAAAVARAIDLAKERGAKRAMELPVSAPFHCSLMQPAADEMQAALAETKISAPAVPVIANVCAAPVSDPEEIRQLLVEQITARVRWRESMIWLADNNAGNLVELGSGKVLATMARRIDPRLTATALSTQMIFAPIWKKPKETEMFDLSGKTALVTGASGGSAGHCALSAWRGRARGACRHARKCFAGIGR